MTQKDLFVIIYSSVWAAIFAIFVIICYSTKFLPLDDASFICNVAFSITTSIIVLVKPIRKWVDRNIISKL